MFILRIASLFLLLPVCALAGDAKAPKKTPTQEQQQQELKRNLKKYLAEFEKKPNDLLTLYNLGRIQKAKEY